MRKSLIIGLILALYCSHIMAQKERPMVRKGNELFEDEKYMEAEIAYRKALENKQDSYEAQYNLAGALYKQKKFKEAAEQYQALAGVTKDNSKLGEIYHNMGNAFLDAKDLEKSITAYKESLKAESDNKTTDQTRYNLAYAKKMLKEQQKQQQEQQQQQQDNKDQDKDKKEEKQDQQEQDQNKQEEQDKKDQEKDKNKDQQNKDQHNEQNKDQQEQQKGEKEEQQQQISKQNAEQILNALKQDEQEVRKKIEAQKAKAAQRKSVEKDW